MQFPWLVPDVMRSVDPSRVRDVQRMEVKRHAALLHRLGRTQSEAAARCRANAAWEHDVHGRAAIANEIDGLVADVYRRGPASTDPQPQP
jgi:hypothetical protein